MKLLGKSAIVTGASTGIGKAVATRLATDGAYVAIVDIADPDVAAAEISRNGTRALAVRADISSEADVAAAIEQTLLAFGRIDILVNNAAMTALPRPFEEIGATEWRRMMDVNTLGPYLCSRAVVPHMRSTKRGRIINIASTTVHSGVTHILHYVSSKGAIIAFTRALARELGKDNITVNAIAPGFTLSERIAKQTDRVAAFRRENMKALAIPRDGLPEDINGIASFLASDDSAFMTGQTIVVDGGLVMI
jgi:NAD(P)-dependent dehydrogenase (short-subunit alcohol dehydrogenase family)